MTFTPSNLHRSVPLKTYSRLPKRVIADEEGPASKKRRIDYIDTGTKIEEVSQAEVQFPSSSDVIPSSPPRQKFAVFSSDSPDEAYDTPPSSPPPRGLVTPRKDKRSQPFFIRKDANIQTSLISSRVPLADTVANGRATDVAHKSGKKKHLKQLQIDLGGDIRSTCKICGMDYIPSNAEDMALHRKFHALNVGGVAFGKAFKKDRSMTKIRRPPEASDRETVEDGFMVVVNRKSSLAYRNMAKRVLEVVNTELSAVSIDDEMLWGHVVAQRLDSDRLLTAKVGITPPINPQAKMEMSERFRFYLYVKGDKCVGLCLVERIKEAYRVLDGDSGLLKPTTMLTLPKSTSISISKNPVPAIMGISRIWVSVSQRRKGIGLTLLSCAEGNFLYGMKVPKELVAFSQPTESGGRLAQAWFGDSKHWRVYLEHDNC